MSDSLCVVQGASDSMRVLQGVLEIADRATLLKALKIKVSTSLSCTVA